MSTTTETPVKKDVKSASEKSGTVPVGQESEALLSVWQTDMEHLMSDMFRTWSGFGRLSPFREFLPRAGLEKMGLEDWTDQADRYFDDLSRQWSGLSRLTPFEMFRASPGILLTPEVDISDGEDKLVVKAELPGMEKDDVDIDLDDNVLKISGKKTEDRQDMENQCSVRERRFGSFRRSFTLPENVVAEKMAAAFDKGILTVTVPKKALPKSKGRKIPVKG